MRKIQQVPLDKITLDPDQPRKQVNPEFVGSLAKSLKEDGLIHPIELDVNYQIIVGELRYRAAHSLGWKTIPAMVNPKKMTVKDRLRRQLAENFQQSGTKGGGQPMNPIDTAEAFAQLYRIETGKSYKEATKLGWRRAKKILGGVAKQVGLSPRTVHEYLLLLEEPQFVRGALRRGDNPISRTQLSTLHGVGLSGELKRRIKRAIVGGKISSREQIKEMAALSKINKDLVEMRLASLEQESSEAANRILTKAAKLGLAIRDGGDYDFSRMDKQMIRQYLPILIQSMEEFLHQL